jgi:hypothetical protein
VKKVLLRTAVLQSAHGHETFVRLWSSAMWVLAALYLLDKFGIH